MTPLLETPELNIPENLQGTFRRMLHRIPREIRDDPAIQHKLLILLKMGNETTARQYIAIQKVKLIDQLTIIQRHARDVVEDELDSQGEGAEAHDADAANRDQGDPAAAGSDQKTNDPSPEQSENIPKSRSGQASAGKKRPAKESPSQTDPPASPGQDPPDPDSPEPHPAPEAESEPPPKPPTPAAKS